MAGKKMGEKRQEKPAEPHGRTVVELCVQNLMRVRMAVVKPKGAPVVVVGGENGAGKSSLIRSLFMALRGKKALPPEPIHRGEERGEAKVDLGDIKVHLVCTQKGEYLKVTTPDGEVKSAQTFLDRLTGKLVGGDPFDPQEFVRLGETPEGRRQQVKTLLSLAGGGFDFGSAEARKAELTQERRLVNKDVERMEGKLALTRAGEVPGEEIPLDDMMKQLQEATEQAARNSEGERALQNMKHNRETAEQDVVRLRERIAELRAEIAETEHEIDKRGMEITRLGTLIAKTEDYLEEHPPVDLAGVRQEIAKAEEHNRAVRTKIDANREYAMLRDAIAEKKAISVKLTGEIATIEKEKEEALSRANLPVDGLGFDEGGVTLNGLPFEQAAESDQYRIGMAIALAMIPPDGIRLVYFKDWDALDSKKKILVAKMAEDAHAQVWAQVVKDAPDGNCLYIEDGVLFDEGEKNGDGAPARAENAA